MSRLRELVKEALGADTLTTIGGGGGCISSGTAYRTNEGKEIFVKENAKEGALRMFVGEEASLQAIAETNTLICPRPVKVISGVPGGGCALIMDYLNLSSLRDPGALGEGLARLHMDNWTLLDEGENGGKGHVDVSEFGFAVETCCGFLPQRNEWRESWVDFFCEKIDHQLEMLTPQDTKAISLWRRLRPKVHKLFDGLVIRPSLLHGDLWSGNTAQTADGVAVFDAASFYGHHEYDLGIASMFGGFSRPFYEAYHRLIPKQSGFADRIELYKLFHNLNHWTHFGSGYRGSSLGIMERLVQKLEK